MAGKITLFATSTIPSSFLLCDGSLQLVATYPGLFAILGTAFGGDGITDFGLPDLRGRTPIGVGTGAGLTARSLADTGGDETHQLLGAELPVHNHLVYASTDTADGSLSNGNVTAASTLVDIYTTSVVNAIFRTEALSNTGGDTAHQNMQPFIALQYAINTNDAEQMAFVGQISPYGSTSLPDNWIVCDGSLQLVATYPGLFAILGTAFGGDGITDFGLPDLRGRTPIGASGTHLLAELDGEETHILIDDETSHTHQFNAASDTSDTATTSGNIIGQGEQIFHASANLIALRDDMSNTGSDTGHENMQPFESIQFMIYAGV